MVAGGLYAAQYADQFLGRAPERAALARQADESRQPASSGRSLTVDADRAGHFKVEGTIKAARANLSRIDVGGIAVHDVAALVLPDEALGQNLLGVSFLSRLRRYEYANGRLVLEQ